MGLLEREVNEVQEKGWGRCKGYVSELTSNRVGQHGIHLVICQTSRTSKHFYNPCTNTTATTIATVGLHSVKGAAVVGGVVWEYERNVATITKMH